MFDDFRSKKIIFVSHCILNQNSISDGTADHAASLKEIVNFLQEKEIGIIQLPCPELICLGLDRGDIYGFKRPVLVENTRIRNSMIEKDSFSKLDNLVNQIIFQIEEYLRFGFDIIGIIGINRSPSCGVETTSINNSEVPGNGIFIERIDKELKKRKININAIGIKSTEIEKAINDIGKLLLVL